jgi:hypothetical protein
VTFGVKGPDLGVQTGGFNCSFFNQGDILLLLSKFEF